MAMVNDVGVKTLVPVELELRLMVCGVPAALVKLPKRSSSCTVMMLEVTPAVNVCASVVNTILLGAAAPTRIELVPVIVEVTV